MISKTKRFTAPSQRGFEFLQHAQARAKSWWSSEFIARKTVMKSAHSWDLSTDSHT